MKTYSYNQIYYIWSANSQFTFEEFCTYFNKKLQFKYTRLFTELQHVPKISKATCYWNRIMFKGTILKKNLKEKAEIKNRRGKQEFSLMLQSITIKV